MAKVQKANDGRLLFYCEGCGGCHGVNETWEFNGDLENPTFHPSILVRGTVPITDEEAERILKGEKVEPKLLRCYSFVTDGRMEYLSDCTHALAGTTVKLKDEEDWFK